MEKLSPIKKSDMHSVFTFEKDMTEFVLKSVESAEELQPGVKFMAQVELDEYLIFRVTVYPDTIGSPIH